VANDARRVYGTLALGLFLTAASARAEAETYALTAADREALTTLARTFFETTRDGTRTPTAIYPTPAELRGLYPPATGPAPPGGVSAHDTLVQRQLGAIERDVRALRPRFAGGAFVGVTGQGLTRGRVELRPCGRFARADSQCTTGLLLSYRVGEETRAFRLDTLVRVQGRWRILDVRR